MFSLHIYYVPPTIKSLWMPTYKCFYSSHSVFSVLQVKKGGLSVSDVGSGVSTQRQIAQCAKYMGIKKECGRRIN